MGLGLGLAISGLLGAGASIFGASSQVSAEQAAIAAQKQMFQEGLQTQQNYLTNATSVLNPWINKGTQAQDWYNYLTGASSVVPGAEGASQTLGMPGAPGGSGTVVTGGAPSSFNPTNAPLTAPFTAATLPTTPGYQFTLDQGLKATQNSYAALGEGTSGASMKGAIDYATGQASNTYNSQFANYLTQNQQIANMLLASGQLGAGAAGTLAGLQGNAGNAALGGAVTTGQGVASSTAGIGNALAGGAAGVAGSLGNSLLMYNLFNKLSSGGTPAAPASGYTTNALATSGAFGAPPLGVGGFPYAGPFQSAFPTG